MGSGASKPPPDSSPRGGGGVAGGGGAGADDSVPAAGPSVKRGEAVERRTVQKIERTILADERRRVDDDVDDQTGEVVEDSDVEAELSGDRASIAALSKPDEDRTLAIKERVRLEAERWTSKVLPPSEYLPSEDAEFAPDESMRLEFVHGYRGWDCSANLHYTVTGDVAFNVAGLGIVLDPRTRRQRFFMDHDYEVTCLAMHPSGGIVATGERALNPVIYIWDVSTMERLAAISDFHEKGISALAFSADGKKLVSAGMDPKHCIVLWEWRQRKKQLSCFTEIHTAKVFSVGFNPVDSSIVATGVNSIHFLKVGLTRTGGKEMRQVKGKFITPHSNPWGAPTSMLCMAFTKAEFQVIRVSEKSARGLCLTGGENGTVYMWKGDEQLDQITAAHRGPVFGIVTFMGGFCTGGKDGKVRVWANELNPTHTYDICAAAMTDVRIRALSHQEGRILVGTLNSQVFEVMEDTGEITLLLSGHDVGPSGSAVRNVSSHPAKSLVCSTGDDSTLRLWDVVQHELVKTIKLPHVGWCTAFSTDGKCVAVGMENGQWGVFSLSSYEEVIMTKDRKKKLRVLAFSPSGRYLAVGSEEAFVDVYDCLGDYDWVGTLQGHQKPVVSIDWSIDSCFIQTSDAGNVLMYWDVKTQNMVPGYDHMRDTMWDGWTSLIGWPVSGLVGSGISNTSAQRSLSGHLIASSNEDGIVRLFKYPCSIIDAECVLRPGHHGTVHCTRFSYDDSQLISCAESDRCVFQWRIIGETEMAALGPTDDFEDSKKSEKKKPEKKNLDAIPGADPGKGIPSKESKTRGGIEGKLRRDDIETAAIGLPEPLPEPEDEPPPEEQLADSDTERELDMDYRRGPPRPSTSFRSGEGILDDDVCVPAQGKSVFGEAGSVQSGVVAPSDYRKPEDADEAPAGSLQMEFIYGYRGHDTRSNLVYTARGEIVFMVGSTGVVYNPHNHTQRFFNGHTDDVICLTMHPDFTTVASGQAGRKSLLCVWDSLSMAPLQIIRGFHDHGICSVGFSGDGSKLVSVGMDLDHSIAVWDWRENRKIASATGDTRRIFMVCFNPSDDSLITAGIKHMKFWTLRGRLLRGRSGDWTRGGSRDSKNLCLCISRKGRIYSGAEDGSIYRWKNGAVDSKVADAHGGPVTTLWVCRDGLCSGGRDGKVAIWSHSLRPRVSFDIREYSQHGGLTRIRSVCWLDNQVLIGTINSEVFELDIEEGNPKLLLQSHVFGRVMGLSTHPSKRLFVSGGDDCCVRLWDMETRQQLVCRRMDLPVTSVCFSVDGRSVASGLDNGGVLIVKARSLRTSRERKDRRVAVTELKYSPNGKLLVAGFADGNIDIYDVPSEYEWVGTCQGHKDPIRAVDWSTDSRVLQSDDIIGNHLFWDIESAKEILVTAEVRDISWATWTCVQGWYVSGIAPKFAGIEGINAAARSPFGGVCCTGDDWGILKMFKFPCITKGAGSRRYGGHSARIAKVGFSFEERSVFSTGMNDGAIIQWKFLASGVFKDVEKPESDDEDEALLGQVNSEMLGDVQVDSDVEQELGVTYGRGQGMVAVDRSGIVHVESQRMAVGDEVVSKDAKDGAIGPTLKTDAIDLRKQGSIDNSGQMVEADTPVKWRKPMDAEEAPYNSLQLEFLYGYRGHDTRGNLRYNADGDVVYSCAAVDVVYRKHNQAQGFYNSHTDDVISMAMHPDKVIIASGQVGKTPSIFVWDSRSLLTLSCLRGFHERGVSALAFSADGSRLASVGYDLDHSICLWEWRTATRLATTGGSNDKIFAVAFSPVDDTLCTVGIRHVKFWQLVTGNIFKGKTGSYGQDGMAHNILCCTYNDQGLALTGSQQGDVFLWKGSRIEWQFEQAHQGAVFAVCTCPDGFISGGKDGKVRIWTGLDPLKIFDFSTTNATSVAPMRIRSLDWLDGKVLVGTMSSEIFELDEKTTIHRLLCQGHSTGEICAVAAHPKHNTVASGGSDRTVRLWRVASHKMVAIREVVGSVNCLAYQPSGTLLAVGLEEGSTLLLNGKTLDELRVLKDRSSAVTVVRYSVDNRYLAIATEEGAVDIYDEAADYELHGTCTMPGAVSGVDWSLDGRYLHIVSKDVEGEAGDRVWDAMACNISEESPEWIRRIKWHTWTCLKGWAVAGLQPRYGEGTPVNAVARSHAGDVLATVDNFGLCKLYRYPCAYLGAKAKRYAGHSYCVRDLTFSHDDKYLITAGGGDRSLLQWLHIVD